MEGPSEGQSGPASAALHTAPQDREGGPNSGCATSSPHQAGASAASDASPGISLQAVRPKLPKRPQKMGEADSGRGPQNAAPHPPLDSAPLSSGSESLAAAADLEPPFGASSGGFGGAAPPTSQEDEGGEEDIQDPPKSPPPLLPKSKSSEKFSMQNIVQSIQGILQLEGGADFPRPLTRHPNQQLFPTHPKSNSSRGSGDRPNSWIPLKQLSRGSTLPKTAGLEVPAESLVCNAGSQAYHGPQGKHLRDPDSSAGLGPGAVGGTPVPRSEQRVPPGHPLAAFPWFHGNLSRLRAAQLVLSEGVRDHGLFLVRHSQTQPGFYVLTLNVYGNVKHVLVRLDEAGRCWVRDLSFPSIFDMLDYFRVHPIPFKSRVSCSATLFAYVEGPCCSSALPLPPHVGPRRCHHFLGSNVGSP